MWLRVEQCHRKCNEILVIHDLVSLCICALILKLGGGIYRGMKLYFILVILGSNLQLFLPRQYPCLNFAPNLLLN